MINTELLREKIKESGLKVCFVAENSGILRETLYNKMSGKSEFTASEIVALTKTLRLSREERDNIFLSNS